MARMGERGIMGMDLVTPTYAGARTVARAVSGKSLYEALERLPEGLTGEILEGQLHTEPRPSVRHASAAADLAMRLGGPYRLGVGGPGGWWFLIEPEIHVAASAELVVPDLAGWRRERLPELPREQRVALAPDWVCEILSPSTRSKDREIKMPLYARYGIGHAWLLDPATQTLEIEELREGEWRRLATFGATDVVAAAPFEAARFRLAELWS